MYELPSFELDLSIGDNLLQIVFFLTLIYTIIISIMLFMQWKKYSPNPLKTFALSLFYLGGTIAIVLSQITLLSLY